MNSYMNTYLFINTTRKEPPVLEYIVQARTPEEAIKQVNYYPYDPEDYEDWKEDGIRTVFDYYGLYKPASESNGLDGYGTQLIEVSNHGTIGKVMGNTSPDQKEVQTSPAIHDDTPVEGYGDGIVRSNRKPMYTKTDNNYWFHIDGLYYNVHPFQDGYGGYPVRWIQDSEPGS